MELRYIGHMERWDDIRFFLTAARAGSLSAASRDLNASQPTVSRKIAALEERLGTRLFDRHPNGLVLTPSGHIIWELANRIEAQTLAIERLIQGLDMRLQGKVRISVTEGLGAFWLVPRLTPFQREHSGISIEVVTDNESVDLTRGEADIAIRLFRPQQPTLMAKRAGYLKSLLYASRSYVQAFGEPGQLEDLAYHSIVDFTWNLGRAPGNPWSEVVRNHNRIAFRTNSSYSHVSAVRAGMGIGLLPNYIHDLFPDLRTLLPEVSWPQQEIWLVWHEDLKHTARLRQTLNYIDSLFHKDEQWFAPSE
jgi:DNA-binding transcriptional LysR family regulator